MKAHITLAHSPPKLLKPFIIVYKNKLHFFKNKQGFNNCTNWPPQKISWKPVLPLKYANDTTLHCQFLCNPTQIKQTLLTIPNKCLVAMCPSVLYFIIRMLKCYVFYVQFWSALCTLHYLNLWGLIRTQNWIFFCYYLFFFLQLILCFTFGFRCFIGCANIEFFILSFSRRKFMSQ